MYVKKRIYLTLSFLLMAIVSYSQVLNEEEKKLYDLIMQYRKTQGLPIIPLSASLTYVAQTHVRDLIDNHPDIGNCNTHSWSDKGSWTECCYTSDHAQAEGMWSKPKELTSYQGLGYEIAFWSSDNTTAAESLSGWKSSSGHNAVVLNKGIWGSHPWKAIGIGIYNNYAVVWFGEELDIK
jgi:hypothetical protein